jgi:hypothetical protein
MTKTSLTRKRDRVASADVPVINPNVTVALPSKPRREAARPANEPPRAVGDEAIRDLAHRKWEAAGRPAGDGLDFWLEAERELNAERAGASAAQASGG